MHYGPGLCLAFPTPVRQRSGPGGHSNPLAIRARADGARPLGFRSRIPRTSGPASGTVTLSVLAKALAAGTYSCQAALVLHNVASMIPSRASLIVTQSSTA